MAQMPLVHVERLKQQRGQRGWAATKNKPSTQRDMAATKRAKPSTQRKGSKQRTEKSKAEPRRHGDTEERGEKWVRVLSMWAADFIFE